MRQWEKGQWYIEVSLIRGGAGWVGAAGYHRGCRGIMHILPQELSELCSIDLQTEGTVRPRNIVWHTDHLGFLEAVA